MGTLGYSSKLNAEWDFLCTLHEEGRKAAEEFLAVHGESIGRYSTREIDHVVEGA
ncbi:hypothetical protein HAP47_0017020 [Bradyrhizobium sp. 41S5]|uniref:hypothetical protein n=1 Tax=Bradyrhizobium sp. 41S5 TaxID=1404443 RepID=UPI00156B8773|nr:hypothetical protein [Bradyrhizobium sp. 41S5]UFX48263.1 hypothetical protein HAP47_0017020 [Bradyrhizobium sp. 41S5]